MAEMTEARAREILGEIVEFPDGDLGPQTNFNGLGCVVWYQSVGNVLIDEYLDVDQLEALAWWMRSHAAPTT